MSSEKFLKMLKKELPFLELGSKLKDFQPDNFINYVADLYFDVKEEEIPKEFYDSYKEAKENIEKSPFGKEIKFRYNSGGFMWDSSHDEKKTLGYLKSENPLEYQKIHLMLTFADDKERKRIHTYLEIEVIKELTHLSVYFKDSIRKFQNHTINIFESILNRVDQK